MGWRIEGIKFEHERSKRYFSPDIDSIIIHVERFQELAEVSSNIPMMSRPFFAAEWRAEVGKFMSGIRLHARASVSSFRADKGENLKGKFRQWEIL